jgi:hypothetical protein
MPTDEEELGFPVQLHHLPIRSHSERTAARRRTQGAIGAHHHRPSRKRRNHYDSEMRRSGGDLNEFPFRQIQRTKGLYEP